MKKNLSRNYIIQFLKKKDQRESYVILFFNFLWAADGLSFEVHDKFCGIECQILNVSSASMMVILECVDKPLFPDCNDRNSDLLHKCLRLRYRERIVGVSDVVFLMI